LLYVLTLFFSTSYKSNPLLITGNLWWWDWQCSQLGRVNSCDGQPLYIGWQGPLVRNEAWNGWRALSFLSQSTTKFRYKT